MGNEMGNNNSGLREEESITAESQGDFTHEVVRVKDVKEENHEKERVIGPDDEKGGGQTNADTQLSSSGNEEKAEVSPPVESSKPETELDENGTEDSEILLASIVKEVEDHDLTTELNPKENPLETSKSHRGNDVSLGKEEGVISTSTSVEVSSSDDPEPVDHHEIYDLTMVQGDQLSQDSTSSRKGYNNISCSSKENGYQKLNNPDGITVSGINLDLEKETDYLTEERMVSQENDLLIDEGFEVTGGKVLDRESNTEINYQGEDIFQPPPEFNLMTHQDCTVEACEENTNLIIAEPEGAENKDDHNPFEFAEKVVSESVFDGTNLSINGYLAQDNLNKESKALVISYPDPASNAGSQCKGAKIVENGCPVDMDNNNQNGTAEENSREAKGEPIIDSKPEMLPTEIPSSNSHGKGGEKQHCKLEEEESSDKQVVLLMRERIETSYSRGITTGEESGEPHVHISVPINAETYISDAPAFLFESQDHQEETEMRPDDAQVNGKLNLELKPENFSDFFVAMASTVPTSSFLEETLVSVVGMATNGSLPEFPHNIIATPDPGLETKSSTLLFEQCSEQCSKVDTAMLGRNNYEAKENAGRFSSDSNPDTLNPHPKIMKSPSFDFVLRGEARDEESEQNPLLYQDKTAIECLSIQVDVSLHNRLPHATFERDSLRCEVIPAEEKVITLERSDSEKSRTPFLGFMKGEEEGDGEPTQASVKKKEQDSWSAGTKEVASVSLVKVKDKHKRRSSLFSNCICCTSVMN